MRITSARFLIPVDLYGVDVYVSLGETDERFTEGLLRYMPEKWVKKCLKHFTTKKRWRGLSGNRDGFYIIRLRNYPKNSDQYGILTHEIGHFVFAKLDAIGMVYHPKYSEEAYTYLQGYVAMMVYNRMFSLPHDIDV